MIESVPTTDDVAERLEGIPWTRLAAAGVGAFLAGYALTVLVAVVGPSSVEGGFADVLTLLAFVFYSAHNVPLEVSGVGRMDWLTIAGSAATPEPAVPVIVFYAIPVAVLLAVGLFATGRLVGRTDDPTRVLAAVLVLAVSYGLTAIAGTAVFTSRSAFGGPARLVLADAVLFGFAYPLVFGAIGAGVAGIVASVRASRSGTAA